MAASSGARLLFGNSARRWLGDLTKLLPKVLRLQLHLQRSSQVAQQPEHGACPRRALSPYDPRQDRAMVTSVQYTMVTSEASAQAEDPRRLIRICQSILG